MALVNFADAVENLFSADDLATMTNALHVASERYTANAKELRLDALAKSVFPDGSSPWENVALQFDRQVEAIADLLERMNDDDGDVIYGVRV